VTFGTDIGGTGGDVASSTLRGGGRLHTSGKVSDWWSCQFYRSAPSSCKHQRAYLFLRDNHNDPFDPSSIESYRMVSTRCLEHQVVQYRHSLMRHPGHLGLGIDSASSADVVVVDVASYMGSSPFHPFGPSRPFHPYPYGRHCPWDNPFVEDIPSSFDCWDKEAVRMKAHRWKEERKA
jgi:hypothetical protein